MSEFRQTQLMEEEAQGWTAAKITAVGAETKVVKATQGRVARILVVDAAINVTPMDGVNAAWDALTNAGELNLTGTPMRFTDSIELAFDGAGSAWILYK